MGTGRLLKSDDFGQKGELDCMEEIPGRKSRSKRMEEVQVPVQSSAVRLGPGCIRKLAIESEESGVQLQGQTSCVALGSQIRLSGELKWLYPGLCFRTSAEGSGSMDRKAC